MAGFRGAEAIAAVMFASGTSIPARISASESESYGLSL